jgi:hypothetical protein
MLRRLLFVLIIIIISSSISKADVIYSPYDDINLAGSFEFIGSYELPISSMNTFNPWVGIGIVSSSLKSFNPSLGSELGFEFRQYFKNDKFKGLNIGIYAGIAYMMHFNISHANIFHENNSIGFVPGLKLSYKIKHKPRLSFEPYFGVSNPFHFDLNESSSFENLGLVFTIGFRIGFNQIRAK